MPPAVTYPRYISHITQIRSLAPFLPPRWHRWQRAIGRVADDRPGGSGEQMSDNSLTPGPSPGTGEGKVCPHPDHGYMVRGGEDLPSRPLSET